MKIQMGGVCPELITDDGESRLLPPYPYAWRGEGATAELVARLSSTRAGNNASWTAGIEARRCLNAAPYKPMFRGLVDRFSWAPARTFDNPHPLRPGSSAALDLVIQVGSACLNWQAHVVGPLPDPVGLALAALVADGPQGDPHLVQGGLRGWQFYPDSAPDWVPPAGVRWLYNHCLYPLRGYAWRGMGTTAWAVAVFPGSGGAILSPDHPEEGRPTLGWWLLSHPVPTGGGAD